MKSPVLNNNDGNHIKARVDQCQWDGFPYTTLTATDGRQIPAGSYQLVWKWDWCHFDKTKKGLYADLDSPSHALWSVVSADQLYVSRRNTLAPAVWDELSALTEEQRNAVAACCSICLFLYMYHNVGRGRTTWFSPCGWLYWRQGKQRPQPKETPCLRQ